MSKMDIQSGPMSAMKLMDRRPTEKLLLNFWDSDWKGDIGIWLKKAQSGFEGGTFVG